MKSYMRYNLNGLDQDEVLLVAKEKQYILPDKKILIGVQYRGELWLWDTLENRARPIDVFRGSGAKPLDEGDYLNVTQEEIIASIKEREKKIGRRIG